MKKLLKQAQNGFTMIEVILVVSLFTMILAFSVPNLFSPLDSSRTNSLTEDVVSLLKEAQAKAINSDTLGQLTSSNYGVHFDTAAYTLFKGNVYSSADSSNFSVVVPNGLVVSPNLPCVSLPTDCNNLIFSQITGEVYNFDPTKNSLCLKTANNNSSFLITTNYLGVLNVQETAC